MANPLKQMLFYSPNFPFFAIVSGKQFHGCAAHIHNHSTCLSTLDHLPVLVASSLCRHNKNIQDSTASESASSSSRYKSGITRSYLYMQTLTCSVLFAALHQISTFDPSMSTELSDWQNLVVISFHYHRIFLGPFLFFIFTVLSFCIN